MDAVIEFNAFYDNYNRFIIKEIAVVSKCLQFQAVFRPPYSKSKLDSKALRTANWLTRNFHKIKWEEGAVTYSCALIRDICKNFSTVYTNGVEKARFLRTFHSNVHDISGSFKADSSLPVTCCLIQHRHPGTPCAIRNAWAEYISLGLP